MKKVYEIHLESRRGLSEHLKYTKITFSSRSPSEWVKVETCIKSVADSGIGAHGLKRTRLQ